MGHAGTGIRRFTLPLCHTHMQVTIPSGGEKHATFEVWRSSRAHLSGIVCSLVIIAFICGLVSRLTYADCAACQRAWVVSQAAPLPDAGC